MRNCLENVSLEFMIVYRTVALPQPDGGSNDRKSVLRLASQQQSPLGTESSIVPVRRSGFDRQPRTDTNVGSTAIGHRITVSVGVGASGFAVALGVGDRVGEAAGVSVAAGHPDKAELTA